MLFTLECLQAQEGDCLLLHWGTQDKPCLAVIDGGPGRVYENTLKPRLEEIAENREVAPLQLDLVMVSHVDLDHIVGIKKLFRDIRKEVDNGVADEDRLARADLLWHNTFNDIVGDGIGDYYKTLTASVQASVNGEPNPQLVQKLENEARKKGATEDEASHLAHDVALLLAGHGEGRDLRIDHEFLFERQDIAALNLPFRKNGKPTLITAELTPEPIDIAGLSFKVVGPLREQIEALQAEFDEFIEERGLTEEAVVAGYTDNRAPNLSSIVALVTCGDFSILLTGDARGDYVLTGLENAGLLENDRLEVDVLKVPHHGSDHNLDNDFFETIIANVYVFSANGRYGNPDRTSFEMLIEARGKNAKYKIILTYPVEDIDAKRKSQSNVDWKPSKHSLKALFKKYKDDGYKFTVVDDDDGRTIELGDEKIDW